MKRTISLAALAFLIALAVVVGNRMSAEAMAVVVGVAAAVPSTLLLVLVLAHRERQPEGKAQHQTHYPPLVIIQGGQPNPSIYPHSYNYRPLTGLPAGGTVDAAYRVLGDE
ncbi:MAG: hypothetical protein PVJ34_00990 [Anaerolineae bacterium]|jgi:hypothetical protein